MNMAAYHTDVDIYTIEKINEYDNISNSQSTETFFWM